MSSSTSDRASLHRRFSFQSFQSTTSTLPAYSEFTPTEEFFDAANRFSISTQTAGLPCYSATQPSTSESSLDSPISPPPVTRGYLPRRATFDYDGYEDDRYFVHHFPVEGTAKYAEPWATLKLYCLSEDFFHRNIPYYVGSNEVSGAVDLHLRSAHTIHSIGIKICGWVSSNVVIDLSNPFVEQHPFLEFQYSVWNKADGYTKQLTSASNEKVYGKMQGRVSFPFSFPSPFVTTEGLAAPPTLAEKDVPIRIRYEISVKITRGTFRTASRIKTPISYIPNFIPESPSYLRQISVRDGRNAPGPAVDPRGWHTLTSAIVHCNRSSGEQSPDIEYTLSLAKPLCYARGTKLPCHLVIKCPDESILERAAIPEALHMHIVRIVKHHNVMNDAFAHAEFTDLSRLVEGVASWQLPTKGEDLDELHLEAEIDLGLGLLPSFKFPMISVEYELELYKVSSSGGPETRKLLLEEPIRITAYPTQMMQTQYPSARSAGFWDDRFQ